MKYWIVITLICLAVFVSYRFTTYFFTLKDKGYFTVESLVTRFNEMQIKNGGV